MLIFVQLNDKTYRFYNLKDLRKKVNEIKNLKSLQLVVKIDNTLYEFSLLSASFFIANGTIPEKYKIKKEKIIIEKTIYQKFKQKLNKLKS